MTNEQQFEYWNEQAGPKWVDAQAMIDSSLKPFTEELIEATKTQAGHSVLDVGCGTGATTVELWRRAAPTGSVLGIDLSAVMLEAAATRARGEAAEPQFRQADAQSEDFGDPRFDRIVSRFGVMFFEDPAAAFLNLRQATRGGGTLSFLCWQELAKNGWVAMPIAEVARYVDLEPGEKRAPGPFAFAERDYVTEILESAGWAEIAVEERVGRMTYGGGTVESAVAFLEKIGPLSRLMAEIESEEARRELMATLMEKFKAIEQEHGEVSLPAATWLVTAVAPD